MKFLRKQTALNFAIALVAIVGILCDWIPKESAIFLPLFVGATYNGFENWILEIGRGVNLHTDTFRLYLSNATPSASADNGKADLAEIANGNGYTAGGVDIVNTWSEAAGVGTLNVGLGSGDQVWTASGGAIAQFRYAAVFDDDPTTPVADPLVCWHDYGSAVDVASGETFTWNTDGTLFTIS